MNASTAVGPDPLSSPDFLAGGGEMGARMRAFAWDRTALGPPESWPQSLKVVTRILLTSRYAMWMAYGQDLTFFCNDAYLPTLGVKEAWALGSPSTAVWAEIWPDIGPRIDRVLRTGEATWDEGLLLFLERSGAPEETYHTFSYSPVPGDAGGVAGMLCVVTEETERVIGERRLKTLRDLASHLAGARTSQEVAAATGRSLDANRRDLPFALTYLFDVNGRAAHPVGGAAEAPAMDPGGRGGLDAAARAILEGSAAVRITDLAAQWDGPVPHGEWDRAPGQALVVPVSLQGEARPAGFLVAGLNPYRPLDAAYTDFIGLVAGQVAASFAGARAYEAERQRAEALAEIDRAKTQFFSNISHEFRTPLTLMLGTLEESLAAGAGLPAAERARVAVVHRNGLRLLKLVNALLEFSRIEAGRIQAVFEPTDLPALTAEIASSFRSATDRAGLALVIDLPPVPLTAYVDRGLWETIVLNLVSNAFKFTPSGEIRVAARRGADGACVEISVADTGIGIPAAELPRLFERFHRVEGAQGRSFEGSGIGLALVDELVRLHGGSVGVTSEPGRGSTFTVRLPMGDAHLPPEQVRHAAREGGGGLQARAFVEEALQWLPEAGLPRDGAADPVPGERAVGRVLLADDNADMRAYVERLLAGRGLAVETAANGAAALAAIRRHPPDLVLSDVMMPVLDGFGLLRALRDDPALSEIPVILLSARAGEEARVEGIDAGADDYLTKPFSARELLARVTTNLGLARARREARAALAESEERFRQLAEAIDAVFYVADVVDNRLLYLSPAYEAIWQRPAADLLADPARFLDAVHPDDRARVAAQAPHRATSEAVETEYRIVRPDGAVRIIRHRAFPVPSSGGRRAVGLAEDVTGQRKADLQLRERSELLRVAQEAGSVGAFEWYPETGRFVVSDVYRRLWGLPPDAAVTADMLLARVHPDDRARSAVARLPTHDNPLEYAEYRMRRFDTGEERWLARRGEIMRVGDGPRRFVGVAFDITEQKRNAARFQGVFNSDLMGFTIFDLATGRTLAINDRFLAMTGHSREEFEQGRWNWRDLTPPEDLEKDERAIAQARTRGWWDSYEKTYRLRDGRELPVQIASAALPGEPGRVVVSVEDISARRAAARALRESEARFRTLADAMPQLVWTAEPDGRVDYYNARREEYAGLKEVAPGRWDWEGIVHPDDRARTLDAWQRAAAGAETYTCEHRLARPDGSFGWHVSRATAARAADGSVLKWYGTATDIADLKAAEAALQALNADLERAVGERTRERDRIWRTSQDAFVVTDPEGRYLGVSPAWERLLGWSTAEVLHKPVIQFVHPDDAAATRGALGRLGRGEIVHRFENRFRSRAGEYRWLAWSAVPEDGLIYAVARDVTDEKARTEEIAAANRQLLAQIAERERVEETLRRVQRLDAVGQLTAGVAHDFNNLLTVVLGNIAFVERAVGAAGLDGRILDRLGYMRAAAQRGATLTAQLLAFSRRQRLEAKTVDLNETVSGMRDLLHSSMSGAVHLTTVLQPDLWPALVDPTQIELVILNLAINARDAMEVGGSLAVETANVVLGPPQAPEEPQAGEYVMIAVADTGTGMTPEVLAKAFEPFFTTKGVGKGSGLGLAQVYGFAKQSGGGVKIDTRLGQGTTIRVFLPRAAEPAPAADAAAPPPDPLPFAAATPRVLLVDDDTAVREVTATLLAELGCEVAEAGSGGAALDLLARDPEPVDLLLVDFAMPGMNGAEVAREAAQRRPGLPILFMTGYADLSALSGVGEERIIQKPFRDGELAAKVRRVLRLGEAAGQLS
ncbi:PAS domain S-box protein [Methylobacterium isbiliense]|nr:PAS domain S-box protein [Methylobacterium isbiliense]MDN3625462.1 PAS domain S-box protein [Methylobacterium isbiliense]